MKGNATAIALGLAAFVITAVAVFAVMWVWFLLIFIFAALLSTAPVRLTALIVSNTAFAVIVVLLPIWIASWGRRRLYWGGRQLGVSSITALVTTAVLMGVAAIWFLPFLTGANGCFFGIAFPLGGGPYTDCQLDPPHHRAIPATPPAGIVTSSAPSPQSNRRSPPPASAASRP